MSLDLRELLLQAEMASLDSANLTLLRYSKHPDRATISLIWRAGLQANAWLVIAPMLALLRPDSEESRRYVRLWWLDRWADLLLRAGDRLKPYGAYGSLRHDVAAYGQALLTKQSLPRPSGSWGQWIGDTPTPWHALLKIFRVEAQETQEIWSQASFLRWSDLIVAALPPDAAQGMIERTADYAIEIKRSFQSRDRVQYVGH